MGQRAAEEPTEKVNSIPTDQISQICSPSSAVANSIKLIAPGRHGLLRIECPLELNITAN